MDFLKRLIIVFASTCIGIIMSEHIFWSRFDGEWNTLFQHVNPLMWLFYFIAIYSFLCIVYWFRVRSPGAVFLAGAAYGWIIEGVIVSTLYDDLPASISVTGLSWHALLTVGVMWYLMRRTLIMGSPIPTALLASGVGAYWTMWGIWWWIEDGRVATLGFWAAYTVALSGVLAMAYWILSKAPAQAFRPTKMEGAVLIVFNVAWFGIAVVPSKPIGLIVLPALFVIVFAALWRNRNQENRPNVMVALNARIRPRNLGALLMIPLVSTILYALCLLLPIPIRTGPAIYVTEEILGFALFFLSIINILNRKCPHEKGPVA